MQVLWVNLYRSLLPPIFTGVPPTELQNVMTTRLWKLTRSNGFPLLRQLSIEHEKLVCMAKAIDSIRWHWVKSIHVFIKIISNTGYWNSGNLIGSLLTVSILYTAVCPNNNYESWQFYHGKFSLKMTENSSLWKIKLEIFLSSVWYLIKQLFHLCLLGMSKLINDSWLGALHLIRCLKAHTKQAWVE